MEPYSTCDQITQLVNKLFVYTDQQDWGKLQNDVFTEQVLFDMSSLGGANSKISGSEICDIWEKGFAGIDAVNHLAGNYLIEIRATDANVFAYATATHYKTSAVNGKTREFVGTYDLHLIRAGTGWRIDEFRYNLKYSAGNVDFT